MSCTRDVLLKSFLILLGMTALGICFVQTGVLNIMTTLVTSGPNSYQTIAFAKLSTGSILSSNRSSCHYRGAALTRKYLKQHELSDIIKHRAEEYRQHQLRTGSNSEDLILAPANSPLQYPIRGFTVAPLKKSLIPGLALQAQKREVYQVSLGVTSGVLSVENVLDRDQVEGQGESELTISSTNLTHLNNLLSRVTYTSTIYHIRTTDMAIFSFEDHEVIFPIKIRRPAVPVLFNPGKDINSQVTITTKTFLRYKQLDVLIKSIRKFYPNIKIIIADDSLKPERVTGKNIEHYIMPRAQVISVDDLLTIHCPTDYLAPQGWFAGRNLAVSQVTTKYFLWVDDDFIFLDRTRIESFVEIMEANPELDVLGGAVTGNQYYFNLEYDEGNEEEGGCLRRIKNRHHQPLPGFNGCFLVDGVVNYFLARTDAVRTVGFDPFLKRVGHSEFFIDGLGRLMVASCKNLPIGHQKHKSHGKYYSFRTQKKADSRRKVTHHFFKNHLQYIMF